MENHTGTTHKTAISRTKTPAPFMVVNPGETILDAATRHRRETGHRGVVIVVAFNRLPHIS